VRILPQPPSPDLLAPNFLHEPVTPALSGFILPTGPFVSPLLVSPSAVGVRRPLAGMSIAKPFFFSLPGGGFFPFFSSRYRPFGLEFSINYLLRGPPFLFRFDFYDPPSVSFPAFL